MSLFQVTGKEEKLFINNKTQKKRYQKRKARNVTYEYKSEKLKYNISQENPAMYIL